MDKLRIGVIAASLGLLAMHTTAQAGIINSDLGNTTPGFNDGDTPAVFVVGGAQGGQPVPFDQGYGTDGLFGGNFSQSWSHSYGAISDPILSATFSFGIYDHDSAASGSQVSSFSIDGVDFTSALDALFETAGEGADSQYDVYSFTLANTMFAGLMDGSAAISLSLQGPGLVFALFPLPGAIQETTTNGANLIFSSLDITTQDQQPPSIPLPSTLALSLLGFGALIWRRQRQAG